MTTLILLVFLQGHDAGTPLGAALVHAAEQALGPGASVVVRSSGDAEISDAASLQAGRAEKAFAVARVSWRSPSLRDSRVGQARVVLTILETGRSAAQTLSFDNADLPVERGRAIGLVLAAMAQPERAAPAAAPSPDKPVAVAPASPPAPAPVPPPPPAAPPSTAARAPVAVTEASPPAPSLPRGELRWALDAAAEQGIALGGAGNGTGATIGVRWQPWRRVGLRAGVRGRFGEVDVAQASSRALAASLGVSFALVRSANGYSGAGDDQAGGRFGLALRADALLLNESLSHLSADDASAVRDGRWLPGGRLLVEAQWALGPAVALLLDAGPELAFGRTAVFLHETQVATLAPLRLVIQGGLMARF